MRDHRIDVQRVQGVRVAESRCVADIDRVGSQAVLASQNQRPQILRVASQCVCSGQADTVRPSKCAVRWRLPLELGPAKTGPLADCGASIGLG